jgi:hypothetical protein
MSKSVFIYCLTDPVSREIRYVGKAKDAKRRFEQHLSSKKIGHKESWIRGLKLQGLRPEMDILEEVHESKWEESERWWISYLRFIGCRLINIDFGGSGAHKVSDSMREKCRLIHLGKKRTPESREKMRLAQLGKKRSLESIEKRRMAVIGKRKGIPMHPNALAALVKFHTERKQSPEQVAKRAASLSGKKRTGETLEKMRKLCAIMRERKAAKAILA